MSFLGRHAAAWMSDAWYRRAWFVGPQGAGLLVMTLVVGLRSAAPVPPEAAGWVHPANDRGRFEAMRTLAAQAKSDPAAAGLLHEKATAGDALAQFFMGQSTDPTIDRAAATAERTVASEQWYRKAAEQNLPIAQADLGNLLAHGQPGSPPDYAEAFHWLQSAASRVPMAQRELGVLYRFGRGVPADPNKAMEFIRAASDHGDPIAEAMLGDALDHGSDGLVVDHAEATRLFQKAAMANNAFAQRRLAVHLRDGVGVAADPAGAHYWFTRAAANGDSYAKAQVEGAAPSQASGDREPDGRARRGGAASSPSTPIAR